MSLPNRNRVVRHAKAALVKTLWSSIGRRNLVRLSRFLSNEARLDVPNSMSDNGELLVQRVALQNAGTRPCHIIDVGANVGDWSANVLDNARRLGAHVELHAFEPAPATCDLLGSRIGRDPAVHLVQAAASDAAGEATLHLVHATAGVNSMHARSDMVSAGAVQVPTIRLDEYCRRQNVGRVLLAKSDAEGHDLAVLRGATGLLEAQAIDLFQFEYNWRWIDARNFLRDVFELAQPLGYNLGKITPLGIERYRTWHPELESFREGNYLLMTHDSAGWFPAVKWWND